MLHAHTHTQTHTPCPTRDLAVPTQSASHALTKQLNKAHTELVLEDLHVNIKGLLFMEKVEVVCGSDGQDVVPRVPHCMQNSPGVVQALNAYLVSPSPWTRHHFPITQYLPQLAHVARGFVAILHPRVAVEDAEEVVIAATDDGTVDRQTDRQTDRQKEKVGSEI